MPSERTILSEANVAVEVGLAGSTPSAGKPRTWGSGEAECDRFGETSPAPTEAGAWCQRN